MPKAAKPRAPAKKPNLDKVGEITVHSECTINNGAAVIYAQTSWKIPFEAMPDGVMDKEIASFVAARIRKHLEQDNRLDELIAQAQFGASRKKAAAE